MKVLFVLKFRDNYGEFQAAGDRGVALSSGLLNSASFVVEMLRAAGIDVKLVQVGDNNDIDREVTAYRPTHVVIEALWVVPKKFDILQALHPQVKWIVRGHSALPFLANEGIGIDWIQGYVQHEKVVFAPNSADSVRDLRTVVHQLNPFWTEAMVREKVPYLPNYYPEIEVVREPRPFSHAVNVACFGAVRPLKNQLLQAVAALEYAESIGKRLRFHINGSRSEQGGQTNLSNLRSLFAHSRHSLVEHPWMPHEQFLGVLMGCDVSLAVSFTETFCIVAADSVTVGTPLVCSSEVMWSIEESRADPVNAGQIAERMRFVTGPKYRADRNLRNLRKYCAQSRELWLDYLEESR